MNEETGEDQRAEERRRIIFENLQNAVLTINLNYEITAANPAIVGLTGHDRDELVGRKCYEAMHGNDQPCSEVPCTIEEVLEKGKVEGLEHTHLKKSGEEWISKISGGLISFRGGEPLESGEIREGLEAGDLDPEDFEIVEVNRDITERKKAEKKEKFLYTLFRQDMRNKIMSSMGFIQLLEDADLPEGLEHYLESAEEISGEAMELVELIEEAERARKGKIGPMDLTKTLRDSVSECESLADEKGVEIDLEREGNEAVARGGYPLKKLFPALIKTRIRKSNPNGIEITVEGRDDEVVTRIEDDGEKLPRDVKEGISEGTYTGETSGLGGPIYYISREIINYYRGSLEVKDSELGGARFDVHLKKA